MLPFPNDLKHFPVGPTFHLTTIVQKCGLQLNDPIDWFKLRLNQPKKIKSRMILVPTVFCKFLITNAF